MGVHYRPSDQEDNGNEALYRQIGEASLSQALVLMGISTSICWMDNMAGHKQSWRILEWVNGNLLTQVTEKPTRRGVMLDLVLTNRVELVENVIVQGSLGYSDDEMVKSEFLRAMRRPHCPGLQENRLWPPQGE